MDQKKFRFMVFLFTTMLCYIISAQPVIVQETEIPLKSGETIARITQNGLGTGMALIIHKKQFSEEYIFFNGKRYGPYSNIMYETISDDGNSILFVDAPFSKPQKIYLDGKLLGENDSYSGLSFIPGTKNPIYISTKYKPDGNLSNTLFLGSKMEGPLSSLGNVQFSPDGSLWAYYGQKDSGTDTENYVYSNNQLIAGPYRLLNGLGPQPIPGKGILYVAEIDNQRQGLFLSGRKLAEHDYIDAYQWNWKTDSPAYLWMDNDKLWFTDGSQTWGPYDGQPDDLSLSPDFSSVSFGVVRPDRKGVDVYRDGQFIQNSKSLARIIYSPDSEEIAWSTANLNSKNYLFYRGMQFDAGNTMLLTLCWSADKEILAFRTRINERNYIMTSTGLRWGPFLDVSTPILSKEVADTITFIAVENNKLRRYSCKLR